MSDSHRPSFHFPQIKRVQLHAFSLYSVQPNITLRLAKGVTCLAGANGIGKSTFLATLNYGLTGAVPAPSRHFLSTGKYFEEALSFTEDFFEGRVSESDRDEAAVSIEFNVGKKVYRITRGLFDRQGLRELSIESDESQGKSDDNLSEMQNEFRYRESLCKDIGVNSFEQFVFLQHFLLTFDESRHLLFWDQKAIPQMLYLCFGGDPLQAAKADQLNRDMERAGSWGRNLQFQANNINKRIQILEQTVAGTGSVEPPADSAQEYADLVERLNAFVRTAEEASARNKDAESKATQAAAEVASSKAEYNAIFESFIGGSTQAKNHPLVREIISTCQCPICSASGPSVLRSVSDRINADKCPLCDSPIVENNHPEAAKEALQAADSELLRSRRRLEEALTVKERLSGEARKAWDQVQIARDAVASFEENNQEIIDSIKASLISASNPVMESLKALIEAKTQLTIQREEAYRERDKFRDLLRELQQKLELEYATAEREFVPRFRSLAELFLGIDLDVTLVANQSTGMKLELEMRGDSRRQEHQLSESQRFFVDIALRMALAQHISSSESPAGFMVDTPEGSLDIAYEDRAGEMFARFARSGHQMFMTANVNTSKLLTTLATFCGPERMKIVPMTGWTELSDVQQRASALFQKAFAEIEAALKAGENEHE